MYGGTGAPFGLTTSNTVVACQLENQQFSKLAVADGPGHPMPLYGQAVITDQEQGLFYTVGGTSGFNYFMDVNVLDLRSSPPAWQSLYRLSGLDDEPEARSASKTFKSGTFKIVCDVKLVSGTGMSSVSTTTNYMYWVEAPASLLTGDRGHHNLQFQKMNGKSKV